ncbi:sensor histidine kinase [Ancylobacter terrae]|uniref:sensor histidine kinase n=1 Tax=Ancylobacter sp. sgz301288 TaxID=3342077 RepID=UPI00385892DC
MIAHAAPAPSPPDDTARPDAALRVLYVDDDPALARLVQRSLSRRGYAVVTAADAASGLARIAEGGIDVVALDHFLPTGTGLDVLAALAQHQTPPPVVYVTGSAETSVAVRALKAGAFDYVAKSIDDEFLELLGSAIDQTVDKARLIRAKEEAERQVRVALERTETLLAEVNHRVANSLSMVAALVRLQANALSDSAAKAALSETQARIMAIAGVHRRLYTSHDVRTVEIREYLTGLIEELTVSLREAGHSASVRAGVEAMAVPTDKAVSIGVIVTELVTNACKYAYPDGAGEIRVRLDVVGPNMAELSIEDDGIGWRGKGPARGTGLGSRVVKAMATSLGAELIYDAPERGTRIRLRLPL